jgi:hypothetical protein
MKCTPVIRHYDIIIWNNERGAKVGVKGRKLKHYSGDFKCSVVEEVLINHIICAFLSGK